MSLIDLEQITEKLLIHFEDAMKGLANQPMKRGRGVKNFEIKENFVLSLIDITYKEKKEECSEIQMISKVGFSCSDDVYFGLVAEAFGEEVYELDTETSSFGSEIINIAYGNLKKELNSFDLSPDLTLPVTKYSRDLQIQNRNFTVEYNDKNNNDLYVHFFLGAK